MRRSPFHESGARVLWEDCKRHMSVDGIDDEEAIVETLADALLLVYEAGTAAGKMAAAAELIKGTR